MAVDRVSNAQGEGGRVRLKGQAAVLREMRDEVAPVFGALPFVVEIEPYALRVPWIAHAILLCIRWPEGGAALPMTVATLADRSLRRYLVREFARQVWVRYLPQWRRWYRRYRRGVAV